MSDEQRFEYDCKTFNTAHSICNNPGNNIDEHATKGWRAINVDVREGCGGTEDWTVLFERPFSGGRHKILAVECLLRRDCSCDQATDEKLGYHLHCVKCQIEDAIEEFERWG